MPVVLAVTFLGKSLCYKYGVFFLFYLPLPLIFRTNVYLLHVYFFNQGQKNPKRILKMQTIKWHISAIRMAIENTLSNN